MSNIGKLILKSPVGMIPGQDRNAEKYNRLSSKGASFVEIGPVSLAGQNIPKQKKKLFSRQPAVTYDVSNKGIKTIIENIQKRRPKTVLLADITYNQGRSMVDDVVNDITKAFSLLYDFVDGFVIDTFRLNEEGSPMLQEVDFLSEVIDSLANTRACYEEEKPIYVRIAPNIQEKVLIPMLDYLRLAGVEGLIIGYNKTSLKTTRRVIALTKGRFPVIACGHTSSVEEALEYFNAGVMLLQTDKRIKKINKAIQEGDIQK